MAEDVNVSITEETIAVSITEETIAVTSSGTFNSRYSTDLLDMPSDLTGETGKVLTVNATEDGYELTSAGAGDMLIATYDPTGVSGDAFDMANMVEAADAKVLTAAERTILGNTSGTNTGDQSAGDFNHDDLANITGTSGQYNHPTDAQMTVLGNTSGTNTGDQDLSTYQLKPSEGAFVDGDKTKLDGIATGAEVNTVDSVNTQTGAVVLDADDIDDTSTTNKFVTATDITNLGNLSGTNTGDQDLSDYFDTTADTTDDITTGTSNLFANDLFDIDTSTPMNSVYRLRMSDSNFIGNSSFEHWNSGTTSAPDSWYLQGTATIARDATPYVGTYSAELTFGAATDGELYGLFTASSLVDYTYSAYVTRISGTGNARMVAQQNFGSYTEDVAVNLPTDSGQQLITLTFKPSADGNYRINFKANDSNGSVWRIDEVKVQESKGVATTWTPAYVDDTYNQNIYGSKYFWTDLQLNGATVITEISQDTTPQLGGPVDWNSKYFMLSSQTVGGSDGNLVYLSGADTWSQADASAEATCSKMLGIRISSTVVLTHGIFTTNGLTAGAIYYASETAGAITTTAPSTTGTIVRVVGYAKSTTELFVDPDKTWVEVP